MRLRYSSIFLVLLLFHSCKDVYDLETRGQTNNLVVNGVLTDNLEPQYIKLSTTAGTKRPTEILPGALVSIADENGTQEYLQDLGDGRYQLDQLTVKARKSGTYTLNIQLPDGRRYQSTSERMSSSPLATDSPYYNTVKEGVVTSENVLVDNLNVKVFLNTKLPTTDQEAYLRWGIDEVYCIIPSCRPNAIACPLYCYIYQPVSKYNLKVIKKSEYGESSLNNLLLQTREVDFTFLVRHYFNVTQYSMNLNAYEYWKKVELITARNGSIFDTPPASIQGNVRNLDDPKEVVYGYFEASAQHITRLFVDRGFVPIYLAPCDWSWDYGFRGSPFTYCQDCLSIKGSTNARPDWFF